MTEEKYILICNNIIDLANFTLTKSEKKLSLFHNGSLYFQIYDSGDINPCTFNHDIHNILPTHLKQSIYKKVIEPIRDIKEHVVRNILKKSYLSEIEYAHHTDHWGKTEIYYQNILKSIFKIDMIVESDNSNKPSRPDAYIVVDKICYIFEHTSVDASNRTDRGSTEHFSMNYIHKLFYNTKFTTNIPTTYSLINHLKNINDAMLVKNSKFENYRINLISDGVVADEYKLILLLEERTSGVQSDSGIDIDFVKHNDVTFNWKMNCENIHFIAYVSDQYRIYFHSQKDINKHLTYEPYTCYINNNVTYPEFKKISI